MNPILFDKYVFDRSNPIPKDLDITGAIAFNRDTKHVGHIHRLLFLFQKVFYGICRKGADPHMTHGWICLGPNPTKENQHIIAHGIFKGIKTGSRDYLSENDVTQIHLYVPKTQELKNRILKYTNQTVYNEKTSDSNFPKLGFSIPDMLKSSFHPGRKPTKRKMIRTALAITDLLKGGQVRDRKNRPRSLFCTPYVVMISQASLIINEMSQSQKEIIRGLDRKQAAEKIYQWLKNDKRSLGKKFKDNVLWQFNFRFGMTGDIVQQLNRFSEIHPS